MSTFTELGTQIGELVEQKNAAYGSSFARSDAFLTLLYPEGLRPDQYADALLLVRIFDKLMRIATDRDALGESPYADIAGYGILGAHLHWQWKEERARCEGSVPDQDAEQPSPDRPSVAEPCTAPSTSKANTAPNAKPALPPHDAASLGTPAFAAPPAMEAADGAEQRRNLKRGSGVVCTWCGDEIDPTWHWKVGLCPTEKFCSQDCMNRYREALK